MHRRLQLQSLTHGVLDFGTMAPCPPPQSSSTEPITESVVEPDTPWVTVVWNDPVNLMTYVSFVFQDYFGYDRDKADRLMLQVHREGRCRGLERFARGDGARRRGHARLRPLGDAAEGQMTRFESGTRRRHPRRPDAEWAWVLRLYLDDLDERPWACASIPGRPARRPRGVHRRRPTSDRPTRCGRGCCRTPYSTTQRRRRSSGASHRRRSRERKRADAAALRRSPR